MNKQTEAIFDSCLKQVKLTIGTTEINAKNIMYVVKVAMEVVEASSVKGADQKIMVNRLVSKLVIDAPISDAKEKLLLDILDEGIVDEVIDLVVSASKGELNLNAAKEVATSCCLGLFKNKCKK
tara:strand:+ start:644 stop:1015 length:372 start_codon:yes stop_codon:yes gene_type:complete